jgi:hypothetical protein
MIEPEMSTTTLLNFDKDTGTITIAEALAEIHRTRRQLDRFEHLPQGSGRAVSPEDAALLRCKCDALEEKLIRLLSTD